MTRCWLCDGTGVRPVGGRCFICDGTGKIASGSESKTANVPTRARSFRRSVPQNKNMNFKKIGLEIASCISIQLDKSHAELAPIVGGSSSLIGHNLLVLASWMATWKVSQHVPTEYANPILEAMHQPFLNILQQDGLDADSFMHDRYTAYYDGFAENPGSDGLRKVASYFVGFCNPTPEGAVYYSLDIAKIIPVAIHMGEIANVVENTLIKAGWHHRS